MTAEQFTDMLGARHYGYVLLQRLVGDKPIAELFGAVDAEVARASFEMLGVPQDVSDAFFAALDAAPANLDAIQTEYGRLFVGPNALPAPPWESIYTNRMQRLIMTDTTLAVRNAYRAEGFISALYPHVPDDHIAIELDFLANMADRALQACLAQDDGACEAALTASAEFLKAHLCAWTGDYVHEMEEHADATFYLVMARTIDAFAKADLQSLESR